MVESVVWSRMPTPETAQRQASREGLLPRLLVPLLFLLVPDGRGQPQMRSSQRFANPQGAPVDGLGHGRSKRGGCLMVEVGHPLGVPFDELIDGPTAGTPVRRPLPLV